MLLIFVTNIKKLLKILNKYSDMEAIHYRGVCIMEFDDLKNDKIIVELRALIDATNEDLDDIEDYCQFMKEMILKTTSSLN